MAQMTDKELLESIFKQSEDVFSDINEIYSISYEIKNNADVNLKDLESAVSSLRSGGYAHIKELISDMEKAVRETKKAQS